MASRDPYLAQRQVEGNGFVVDYSLTAGAVAATHLKAVKSTSHQIFVQRVTFVYTTHVDGKTIDIQDDNTSPILVARKLDDAEGNATFGGDVVTFDYGVVGKPLTLGKNLDIVANTGGSGSVAEIHIEGYQKLTSPVTPAQAT